MEKIIINVHTDGGSRGNPGQAATGIFISNEKHEEIHGFGIRLGIATNNVAEYTAVIQAFDWILSHKERWGSSFEVHFYMDSLLVCSQVTGKWKIKDLTLAKLHRQILEKQHSLGVLVTYTHVPREQNKQADAYVNRALDNLL